MQYYLVGGALRDLLLGRIPKEFDWAFDGSVPDFLQSQEQVRKVGRGDPVYLVNGNDHVPLRGENIAVDLTRRDFTINALALDASGILHMHPQALADLRDGVIRPASPESFAQDPARVFRAARFSAVFPDFALHEETLKGMRHAAEENLLPPVAAERVGRELQKALGGLCPGNFLRALAKTNCLAPWFAELEGSDAIPAGPEAFHGSASVLEHTASVMDKTAALCAAYMELPPRDIALSVWMALCHDLGKHRTDPALLPRHTGHETRGEEAARLLARRLRLPARWEKAGILAARLHMKGGIYTTLRIGTKVDLLVTLHAASLAAPFAVLVAADSGDRELIRLIFEDLDRILPVSLPVHLQNLGVRSGQKLRELRCQALAGTPSRIR